MADKSIRFPNANLRDTAGEFISIAGTADVVMRGWLETP